MNDDIRRQGLSAPAYVPVCAIGASAGGVAALQGLFRHLPDKLGLAYVVILHLSPDHPSAMSEILSACTRMPVLQIDDGPTLKANCVFVIPPDRELVINGDSVTARPFSEPRGRRAPIDMFFRSVAAARGDGIAVVLSGAGADGALGVRAIKEAGGVIMVQEPAEADFGSMPQNAIATGVADFVAPLARLAERVAEVAHSKEAVRSLDMDGGANDLRRIVATLRARTGHDFSSYKRATVLRRVTRRMQVCAKDTLAAYADYLLATPEESKELFSDLLISVTMFFRDPRTYDALAQHAIRPLFDDLDPEAENTIRAWVVGCATGEEAYSLAILLQEEATRRKLPIQVQIFATDLDEAALAIAREGRYPRSIEADVPEERLARFFIDDGTHYRVRKELREGVLFASHSVIKEPPFMRLDLISCRNLLIYLERSMQQQLCSIFHYGLKPGRYLFLGPAETADIAADLFIPIDRDARIYCARARAQHTLPILPQFATPERPATANHALPARAPERHEVPTSMHISALERSAPPSVLVDDGQNILHLSPSAGRFILPSGGQFSSLLPAVVRPELRLDLRLALSRALDGKEPTLTHPIRVAMEGGQRRIAMHVAPVPNEAHMGAQALVVFLDGGSVPDNEAPDAPPDTRPDEVRRLHAELKAAQEALVASRTGHDAAIQDLRATNEELQSINEEYRSTAEELETSKEELQSINEELHTVNAELKSKLGSVSVAHNDLQNLTAATEIGTLFLDSDLRIRMFTSPIAELFNITKADIGRTLTDFTHRLEYDGLADDARRVLRDLTTVETEVRSKGGQWYAVRLRPYRTVENRIDGTVVTFVDTTARRLAEAALRASEERQAFLLRLSDALRLLADPAEIQGEACRLLAERLDVDRAYYVEVDEAAGVARVERDLVRGGAPSIVGEHQVADFAWSVAILRRGERHIVGDTRTSELVPPADRPACAALGIIACMGAPLIKAGRLVGALCVTASRPRTWSNDEAELLSDVGERIWAAVERARTETALRESETRFRGFAENSADVLWIADRTGTRLEYLSPAFERVFGEPRDAILADLRRWEALVHPDDREGARSFMPRALAGEVAIAHYRVVRPADGRTVHLRDTGFPIRDPASGAITHVAGIVQDITDMVCTSEALEAETERFRSLAEGIPQLVWRSGDNGQWTWSSPQWQAYTGQSQEASLGLGWLDPIHPDDRGAAMQAWAKARKRGALDVEFRVRRAADNTWRWHATRSVPLREAPGPGEAEGRIVEWLGATTDIEDLKHLQNQQQILVAELQHRTRNLLAVVRNVAQRSIEASAGRDEYDARLAALGRVQGFLSRASHYAVPLADLVDAELKGAGNGSDRVTVGGPPVDLPGEGVQVVALALHELATNALKYGAIVQPAAKLSVTWRVEPADQPGAELLVIDWDESGVAMPDVLPERRGYGSELITEALPYQLQAETSLTFTHDGVRCRIVLPPGAFSH